MKALEGRSVRLSRTFARALGVLSLLGWTVPVQATTLIPLTLSQQIKKADLVLYVRVLGVVQENRTLGKETLPWQVYTLEVLESLVGDAATLPQKDGKPTLSVLGGADLTLEGAPTLKAPLNKDPGGEYILMLYKGSFDSPFVGFNQGVYPALSGKVQNSPRNLTALGDTDLQVFKNKVIVLKGNP